MRIFSSFLFLFLLIIWFDIHSQSAVKIRGKIVDSENIKVSVPFATLSLKNKNFYFTSDEFGGFSIECLKCLFGDTIVISSIGYNAKSFVLSNNITEYSISLEPSTILLQEITIRKNNSFDVIVGNTSNKPIAIWGFAKPGTKLALYIPNFNLQNAYITKLKYYIKRKVFEGWNEPFKIDIYSKNKNNNEPYQSILKEALLVRAEKNDKWLELDISQFNIKYPQDGFFVVMELLPNDEYQYQLKSKRIKSTETRKKENIEYLAIPTITGSEEIYKNLKNWIYWADQKKWKLAGDDFGTLMMGAVIDVYDEK